MRGKKGQFFILATLIIATLIASFTIGANGAFSRGEQDDFPVFAEEFDYELSKMIDLRAATGNDNISAFLNDSVDYMRFVYPETGMVVYYLDDTNLHMENFISSGSCINVSDVDTCKGAGETHSISDPDSPINVSVNGTQFEYDTSKGSKSYIVFMREINDEVHIYVKE